MLVMFGALFALIVSALLFAALWRFITFRHTGSQGLLRALPADGAHGWRHGVFVYTDTALKFYKVRSLSFACDVRLRRRGTTIDGFRDMTAEEREFMPGFDRVITLSSPGGSFEFASDHRAEMALVSWIESAPSERYVNSGVPRKRLTWS